MGSYELPKREIKFRVWCDGLNEMQYISFEDHSMWALHESEHQPIMQYTGLKDKNLVEIYEGDIISINDRNTYANSDESLYSSYKQKIINVYYTGSGFYPFNRLIRDGDHGVYRGFTDFEIIGNIFENPELIDG